MRFGKVPLKTIGNGCICADKLIFLRVPEGVENISGNAVIIGSLLKTLVLPSTLRGIGRDAFSALTNILKIQFTSLEFSEQEYRTLEKNSPVSSSYELLNAENGNSIALDYAPLPKELINNITTEHIMYSSKKSSAARCSHFLFCLALGSDFKKILFVSRPA